MLYKTRGGSAPLIACLLYQVGVRHSAALSGNVEGSSVSCVVSGLPFEVYDFSKRGTQVPSAAGVSVLLRAGAVIEAGIKFNG